MRTLVLAVIVMFISGTIQAQVFFPGNNLANTFGFGRNNMRLDTLSANKWSLNKYAGMSTTFSMFNGGSATIFAAPVGLQLNRRLTNNVYAFAGVNVAPAFVNFRSAFMAPNDHNKAGFNSMRYRQNNFGIYSRGEVGLMYINDERTFQISGSFGVERRQIPAFGGFQPGQQQRQPVIVR